MDNKDVKIYHASKLTGEFFYRDKKSVTEAREHPVRKGTYILPAGASFIEPPPYKQGHATVLKNGEWIYVEDNRGKDFWDEDGNRIRVELGQDISKLKTNPPEVKQSNDPSRDMIINESDQFFMKVLRSLRDVALREYCDKFALINFWNKNVDEIKMKEWEEYRQKLLDITKNENTISNLKNKIIQYQETRDLHEVIPRPPKF